MNLNNGRRGKGQPGAMTIAMAVAVLLLSSLFLSAGARAEAPNPPTNLEAGAGDGEVVLTWDAPESIDGVDIDHYNVYQDGALKDETQQTQITMGGLSNDRQYTFIVTAVNETDEGTEESVPSESVTATPQAEISAPGPPTSFNAVAGDAQAVLSWRAPNDNGGADIDYYIVYQDGISVYQTTSTSATITNLINGNVYSFSVAAHNSAGFLSSRSVSRSVTPLQEVNVPGAPTGLTATPGTGQVSLFWTAPADNGGSPIDYYVVYQDDISVAQPSLPYVTIAGLTAGQTYNFTVAAHNSAGQGARTAAVTAVPVQFITVPGVPLGLIATAGSGQVSLSWTAPDDGGAPINHYIVFRNGEDVAHTTTTSAVVTGLANGQTYSFTVAAHNLVGLGAQTVAVVATPEVAISVPGMPTELAVKTGDGQVTLSWIAPKDNGGSPIDYYIIYQDGENVALTTSTSTTITGLTNGQIYSYSVVAHSSGGLGTPSAPMEAVPKANGGTDSNWSNLALIGGVVLVAAMGVSLVLFRNKK
jgi:chitodextrinase